MSFRHSRRRSAPASGAFPLLLALAACGDSSGPSTRPTTLQAATPRAVTGVVGEAVEPAPAIRVLDGAGRPLAGVDVRFSAVGGGYVAGVLGETDANGVAAVRSWTLGPAAGAQSLVATVELLDPLHFLATAVAGAPVALAGRAGLDQIEVVGTALAVAPTVRVEDAHANPIAGVAVIFEVTAGGGSVTGESGTSDEAGEVVVGSWTLGPAEGVHVLTARFGEIALPIVARAVPPSRFDIDVVFLSTPTAERRIAVERAAARWRKVIVGDAPDIEAPMSADFCGLGEPAFDGTIDDLRILVDFRAHDGPGGVLAFAGPCAVRVADGLTVVGGVVVDRDDAVRLEREGQLEAIVQHEIGHVLGIGTLWFDHVVGAGGDDPHYTGPAGRAAFLQVGGASYVGNHVPVENFGGSGTRDGHWRERDLRTELMTGYAESEGTRMPLSLVTIGALEDLGYLVTPWGDDAYAFGAAGVRAEPGAAGVRIVERPLPRPVVVLDASGKPVDPRLPRPRVGRRP